MNNLSGLHNIESSSINNLYLTYNSQLSDCDVWNICQYLAAPNGTIEIYNNATGCNSIQEVEDACLTSTNKITINNNKIQIYPNPTNKSITIEYSSKILSITIFNQTGSKKMEINSAQNKIDISTLQPGLYFIEVKTEFGITREKLIIH